VENALDA
jgi:hypothetical protein